MKKTSILNVGAAALAILPFSSIISCANAGGVSAKVKDDAFYENLSVDPIIKEESFSNIINRIQKSSALKKSAITAEEFEKGMKTVFQEELILDPNSQVYKELEDANKLSEFKNGYIDEAYQALVDEIKNEGLDVNDKSRHWVGFFNWHSWEYVGMRTTVFGLQLLVVLDAVAQFLPDIIFAVQQRSILPVLLALAKYNGVMPITKWVITKMLNLVFEWKRKTNCPSTFRVWGINIW